jgi:hypothetical protein
MRKQAALTKKGSGDLPVGRFVGRGVQPHLQKYFCFRTPQITSKGAEDFMHDSGASRRGVAKLCLESNRTTNTHVVPALSRDP